MRLKKCYSRFKIFKNGLTPARIIRPRSMVTSRSIRFNSMSTPRYRIQKCDYFRVIRFKNIGYSQFRA